MACWPVGRTNGPRVPHRCSASLARIEQSCPESQRWLRGTRAHLFRVCRIIRTRENWPHGRESELIVRFFLPPDSVENEFWKYVTGRRVVGRILEFGRSSPAGASAGGSSPAITGQDTPVDNLIGGRGVVQTTRNFKIRRSLDVHARLSARCIASPSLLAVRHTR